MQTFDFKVEQNYTVQHEPNVSTITFGGGYEQTAPKGLNHNRRKYQGVIVRADRAEAERLRQFLNTHGGYKRFQWLDKTSGQMVIVRCRNWSYANTGAITEFSLNFEEVM
ncbi:phage tail protein [Mannheimia pernigra]|uniref:phage tail protein n=1 Tax=Mannheimia pernigra TaxID=111844 RepID=UPI00159F36FE|nr:phage tail protein [Mannheimia pernigra]QLB44423.1 phage tail protein [Mannheimia pernigra]